MRGVEVQELDARFWEFGVSGLVCIGSKGFRGLLAKWISGLWDESVDVRVCVVRV